MYQTNECFLLYGLTQLSGGWFWHWLSWGH